ncbi:2-desacetyl-2-hydroxyethyl bacteriochlorophyllide A dehydrogenase [Nocardia sp. GAS34]|uniref:zinc-dependent alcohol dehydrogenase n=1 Tax=unclassified Nocardia TaxID=2637762 RepID=UPI003D21CD18
MPQPFSPSGPLMSSRAVYVDAPGQVRVAEMAPREPGPGEALVRVAWAGICGSDLEVVAGTRPAPYVSYPVTPGHEWSGTVDSVGPDVAPGLVGKKVVGEGFRSCLRCDACRSGDTNLCVSGYAETGFTDPGAWAGYLTLPARLLHVLPDAADLRAAAALEPAACVAAACLKIAVQPGERVAVVGAGTLGLLATQLLAAVYPGALTVIDRRAEREPLARLCGATHFTTHPTDSGARYDAVLEAAGGTATARLAIGLVRRGGRAVLTGIPAGPADPISPSDLVLDQITVHTVFGAPSRAWTYAVRAFAAGALNPAPLMSREFPLEEVSMALQALRDGDSVKVLLRP